MNQSYPNFTLKKRAKTFYFASLFFSKQIQNDIQNLYLFCRYIDDLGDDGSQSIIKCKIKLEKIKYQLRNGNSDDIIISNFIELSSKYKIETEIPLDLINGVISDLKEVNINSYEQLIDYSYKVAGTVGLMMCKIMKVEDKFLKQKAVLLGIAMQLTNIARDIKEDLKRNRVYFPKEFRSKSNKDFYQLLDNRTLQKIFSNDLQKLLDLSDEIYETSWYGVVELPLKFRFPIAIASYLYQSIGKKIRIKNCDVWNERIYLTRIEKITKTILICYKLIFKKKDSRKIDTNRIKLVLAKLNPIYRD